MEELIYTLILLGTWLGMTSPILLLALFIYVSRKGISTEREWIRVLLAFAALILTPLIGLACYVSYISFFIYQFMVTDWS